MFHEHRTWTVKDVGEWTPEDLADKFTQYSWTLCAAWRRDNVLYLNDSLSEDGAFECAVVLIDNEEGDIIQGTQVESITFGGMEPKRAATVIREYDTDEVQQALRVFWSKPVTVSTHPLSERCSLCA